MIGNMINVIALQHDSQHVLCPALVAMSVMLFLPPVSSKVYPQVAPGSETLLALTTSERSLARVSQQMLLHRSPLRESQPAVRARVRPLPAVSPRVLAQLALCLKPHAASATRVRLFTGVYQEMYLQGDFLREADAALKACERLVPAALVGGFDVKKEADTSREAFVAVAARVRFLPGVMKTVTFEVVLARETFAAFDTFVLGLTSVSSNVDLQVVFAFEAFAAESALMKLVRKVLRFAVAQVLFELKNAGARIEPVLMEVVRLRVVRILINLHLW